MLIQLLAGRVLNVAVGHGLAALEHVASLISCKLQVSERTWKRPKALTVTAFAARKRDLFQP